MSFKPAEQSKSVSLDFQNPDSNQSNATIQTYLPSKPLFPVQYLLNEKFKTRLPSAKPKANGSESKFQMPQRRRDFSINREALQALVVAFGPSEAARQANLNRNTVCSLARRFKWRKKSLATNPDTSHSICTKPAGDALQASLDNLKRESMSGLATYSARAARKLANVGDKEILRATKQAVDVANVHKTLWPADQNRNDILQIGILIGPQTNEADRERDQSPAVTEDSAKAAKARTVTE